MQSIDNPQPLTIPTRVTPSVVASSRQLIPLGTVEMGGKSYYKFDTGCEWYKAIKFYEVEVIRSINQMAQEHQEYEDTVDGMLDNEIVKNVVLKKRIRELEGKLATVEPAKVVAEPVSPTINIGVVEPEVESEPGAKIVRWYANNASDRQHAEKEIAALEAKGWIFRGISSVSGSDEWDGEYSVLYVRPQAAVKS